MMTDTPAVQNVEYPAETLPEFLQERYAGNGHYPVQDASFVEMLCVWLQDLELHARVTMVCHPMVLRRLGEIETTDPALYYEALAQFRVLKLVPYEIVQAVKAVPRPLPDLDAHETLTELLAAQIPPPMTLFDRFLHEGMVLFGGKSKRGKSWLIFDLAISVAIGRAAFGHFACPAPQPVLFLALEDGRRRLQSRARAIQDNLQRVDNFHVRYRFPSLAEGGIERLAALIEQYHYGLIVIDVLAKLEAVGKGRGEKSYHEVYSMFDPLQELRKKHPFALVMLTHLRKQEADDAFDSLHGSVAYQGAQDMLWVLERKPHDDYAFLHMRGKDTEEATLALHQQRNGPWEYIGEGEEYALNKTQRDIMKVLQDESDRALSIQEILKACGLTEAKYAYLRKTLSIMAKEDLIHRTQHGKYAATLRGIREMGNEEEEYSDVPF